MILDRQQLGPAPHEDDDFHEFIRGKHPYLSLATTRELLLDYRGEPLVYLAEGDANEGVLLVFDAGYACRPAQGHVGQFGQHFYYLRFANAEAAISTLGPGCVPTRASFEQCSSVTRFAYQWKMYAPGRSGDELLVIERLSSDEMPGFGEVYAHLELLSQEEP